MLVDELAPPADAEYPRFNVLPCGGWICLAAT
jgi:hypothetical protein